MNYDNKFCTEFLENDDVLFSQFPKFFEDFIFKRTLLFNNSKSVIEIEIVLQISKLYLKKLSLIIVDRIQKNLDVLKEEALIYEFLVQILKFLKWLSISFGDRYQSEKLASFIRFKNLIFTNEIIDLIIYSDNWELIYIIFCCFNCFFNVLFDDQEVSTLQFEKLIAIYEVLHIQQYRLLDDPLIEKKILLEETFFVDKSASRVFDDINNLKMNYYSEDQVKKTLFIKNIMQEFDFKESSFLIAQKLIQKESLSKSINDNPKNYVSLLFHIKILKTLNSNPRNGFIIFLCHLLNNVVYQHFYDSYSANRFVAKGDFDDCINFSYLYLMLDDFERQLDEDCAVKFMETCLLFNSRYFENYMVQKGNEIDIKLKSCQALLSFLEKKLKEHENNDNIIGLIVASFENIYPTAIDEKFEASITEQVLFIFNDLTKKLDKNIFKESSFIDSNPHSLLSCLSYFSKINNTSIKDQILEKVETFWHYMNASLLSKDVKIIENQFLYQTFFLYCNSYIYRILTNPPKLSCTIEEFFIQIREKMQELKNSEQCSFYNLLICTQMKNLICESETEKEELIYFISEINLLGFHLPMSEYLIDHLIKKIESFDNSIKNIKKDKEFFKKFEVFVKAMFNSRSIYDTRFLLKEKSEFLLDYVLEEFVIYLNETCEPILNQEQELIKKLLIKSEVSFVEKNVLLYLSKKHEFYSKDINHFLNCLLQFHGMELNLKDYKQIYIFLQKSLSPIVNLYSKGDFNKRVFFYFEYMKKNESGILTNAKIALDHVIEKYSAFEKAFSNLLDIKLENDFFIDKFHKGPNLMKHYDTDIPSTNLNKLLNYFAKVENKEETYNNWKIVREFEFHFQFFMDVIYKYEKRNGRNREITIQCLDEAKKFFVTCTRSRFYYNVLKRFVKEYLPFSLFAKNDYIKKGNYKYLFEKMEENLFNRFFHETLENDYRFKRLRTGFVFLNNLWGFSCKFQILFPGWKSEEELDLLYYGVANSLASYFLEEFHQYSDEETSIFSYNLCSIIQKSDEKIPILKYPQLFTLYKEGTICLARIVKKNNITENVIKDQKIDDQSFKNLFFYYIQKNFCTFVKDKIISNFDGEVYLKHNSLQEAKNLIDNYIPICEAMFSMEAQSKNSILSNICDLIPSNADVEEKEKGEKEKLFYLAFKIRHILLKHLCIRQIENENDKFISEMINFFTKFSTYVVKFDDDEDKDKVWLKKIALVRCDILAIIQSILDSLKIDIKLMEFTNVLKKEYINSNDIKYDEQIEFKIDDLSLNCKVNLALNLFLVFINLCGFDADNVSGGVANGRRNLNSSVSFRLNYLRLVKELKKLILENKDDPDSNKSAFYLLTYPLDGEFVEIPQDFNENWEDLFKLFIEYNIFLRSFQEFNGFKDNHSGNTFKNILATLLQILNKFEKGIQKEYLVLCFEEFMKTLDVLKVYEIHKRDSLEQERFSFFIMILKLFKFFDIDAVFSTSSAELMIKNCFYDKSNGNILNFIDFSLLKLELEDYYNIECDIYSKLLINICDIEIDQSNNSKIKIKTKFGIFQLKIF